MHVWYTLSEANRKRSRTSQARLTKGLVKVDEVQSQGHVGASSTRMPILPMVNFLDTNHYKGGVQRFDNVFVKVIEIHYFLMRKMYVNSNNELDSIE